VSCKRPGRDRDGIHAHRRQDLGDRERMSQIGLAREPHLPLVHLRGVDVGLLEQRDVRVRSVRLDLLDDLVDARHLAAAPRRASRMIWSSASTALSTESLTIR